ncbi:MAG: hypothetical protein EPN47_06330 [Acidobacteria bacterium]|nr:MAG: hypothetical protein EPN47_06330 [Acidobacteriota bacterium]
MKHYSKACAAAAFVFAFSLAVAGTARLFGQDLERADPIQPSTATEAREEQAQPTTQNTANATSGAPSDYVIGPEDVLDITVFDVPDLNQTVRVANDGTIGLPLLGRIAASGLTVDQLRDRLETAMGKSLVQNPQVSVFVKQFQARPVSIMGAVEKPGLYQITGPRTLIEMLSVAGGLAKRSTAPAGKTVYVSRPGGFKNLNVVPGMEQVGPDKIAIDLKDLLYTQAKGLNIPIEPHDIIAVSKADVIYVAGSGVRRPGGFILEDRDSVTVVQALALAQGLDPNAAKHKARIIHTKADGTRVEIPVDLDKIVNEKAADPEMSANDILYVPNSRSKAAAKKTAETIVQTVSGFLIFHP